MITNKKIFRTCYENFINSSSNYYSDTWKATSYQNTFFKKKLELDEFYTNNNIRGLAPLDNYPSTSYLNNNNKVLLKKLHHNTCFDTYKKIEFKNQKFGSSFLIAYRYFSKIYKLIKRKSNVLIIGDGLGILSFMILKNFNCKIFLCDLSESLIYQEYNHRSNFKKKNFNYVGSNKDSINLNSDVNFINADQLHRLKFDIDLAINTDSFCEMDKISVDNYFKFVNKNLKINGHFFYCNKGGLARYSHKSPADYPLENNFVIKHLEVMYPSHRDTYNKYLAILAKKKYSTNKLARDKKNFYLRKKLINKFFNDTEKIFLKGSLFKINKKTIQLINKTFARERKQVVSTISTKKLYNYYNYKKVNSKRISYDNYYHFLMSSTISALEKNNIPMLEANYKKIIQIQNKYVDETCIIKLATIFKFYKTDYSDHIVEKIKNNSFEKIYCKISVLKKNNFDNSILLKKLEKFKDKHFFDELKLVYLYLNNNDLKKFDAKIAKLEKLMNNKLKIINLLKIIFNSGKFEIFLLHLKKYKKQHKLSQSEINEIFLSTCFVKDKTIQSFTKNFSRFNFGKNQSIDNLILKFKSNQINEINFINKIFKKKIDYYQIGHILKNTINKMSKKNVKKIAYKSLLLRPNIQNDNFISEIFFYNNMFQQCYDISSNIKNLKKFSIFYDLKRVLSKIYIKKKIIQKDLIEISHQDCFKSVHNGRVALLPFLCTGTNAVTISGN